MKGRKVVGVGQWRKQLRAALLDLDSERKYDSALDVFLGEDGRTWPRSFGRGVFGAECLATPRLLASANPGEFVFNLSLTGGGDR